ncbi:MAG: hypothetical protein RLZZ440_747 [Planctomycetota bacterium]|jgi:integrase
MRVPGISRHRATGQFVTRLSGRDHYLGKDEAEAKRRHGKLVASWLASGKAKDFDKPDQDGPLLAEVVDKYLDHIRAYYRPPSTEYEALSRNLSGLGPWLLGPADAFGPQQLSGLRATWVVNGNARTHVNQRVGRVLRAFRWAVSECRIKPEQLLAFKSLAPLKAGRSDTKETEARRPVDEADFRAALPFVTPPLRAVLELLWLTGARPSEILKMRTGDVDRSGSVWLFKPRRHKNSHRGQDRTIPLGPQAQAILKPWLRADPDAFLFQPREAIAELRRSQEQERWDDRDRERRRQAKRVDGVENHRQPGEFYDHRRLSCAVARACKWAGCAHWSPYQLRHAAGTRVGLLEGSVDAARVQLGKRSLSDTARYATHGDITRAVELAMRYG